MQVSPDWGGGGMSGGMSIKILLHALYAAYRKVIVMILNLGIFIAPQVALYIYIAHTMGSRGWGGGQKALRMGRQEVERVNGGQG